jgi:hypothetical protein
MHKKNLFKIPDLILVKAQRMESKKVVVSTALNFKHSEIMANLRHLSIRVDGAVLKFEPEILPKRERGRFSRKNLNGFTIIRKDKPKIKKQIHCGDRPYFGDWSKGSFSLVVEREVYQRDFHPPQEISISISLVDTKVINDENQYLLKFTVNKVLDLENPNFENQLLYCLNLLQENIGKVDVFSPNASEEEYMKNINLLWDIFPPGVRNEDIERILEGKRTIPNDLKQQIEDKYDFLVSLNPQAIITGTSGMRRYFGAKYSDNLVVFENLEYGNAIYVMYENWDELSKLTRTQLLSRSEKDFDRVKHTQNWKSRIASIIKKKLNTEVVH